jgi:enamine deaminase RidA (YjgF/YER057c/UK114 family)
MVQVSGQGGTDAAGEYPADIAAQTTNALHNVLAILEVVGATFDDVIMMRCYLTSQSDFPAMNEAYTAFMTPEHLPSGVLPARTTVFVGLPFPQMLVEIDALAVIEAESPGAP